MKLLIAIVQDEDAARLTDNLMQSGLSVTKLATTGGFLHAGNTTLLIGLKDEQLEDAIRVIDSTCKTRRQLTTTTPSVNDFPGSFAAIPFEVTVGGATVFVVNVEQFYKI